MPGQRRSVHVGREFVWRELLLRLLWRVDKTDSGCGGTTTLFFVLFLPSRFNILEYFDAYGCILIIKCYDAGELTRTIFCLPRGILNARKQILPK